MQKTHLQDAPKASRLFFYFICFTIFASVSRLGELVPPLGALRINFVTLVVSSLWFLVSGMAGSRRWLREKEVRLMAGFTLLAFATIPFSVWPSNAFQFCAKGPIIINLAIFFFCFVAVDNKKDLRTVLKVFSVAVVVLVAALFINPELDVEGRYSVTRTYDPNEIALLFACAFPIFVAFFLTSKLKGKILSTLVLVMLIMSIFKTGSRGGLLALLCCVGLISFSPSFQIGIFKKLFIAALISIFFLTSHADKIKQRWQEVLEGVDYNFDVTEASAGRLAIWKETIQLIVDDHLIVGAGTANSRVARGTAFGNASWKATHNSFLQAWLDLGTLGILLFVLIIRAIIKNCNAAVRILKKKRSENVEFLYYTSCLKISFISYLVSACFLSQLYSIVVPFFLATSVGLRNYAVRVEADWDKMENNEMVAEKI